MPAAAQQPASSSSSLIEDPNLYFIPNPMDPSQRQNSDFASSANMQQQQQQMRPGPSYNADPSLQQYHQGMMGQQIQPTTNPNQAAQQFGPGSVGGNVMNYGGYPQQQPGGPVPGQQSYHPVNPYPYPPPQMPQPMGQFPQHIQSQNPQAQYPTQQRPSTSQIVQQLSQAPMPITHPSQDTSFVSQHSEANSGHQVAPPVLDLSSYMGGEREFSGMGPMAGQYIPQPEQRLYDRIKGYLRIAQIFPKREDIEINSRVKAPDQGAPQFWCHVYYYEQNERVGEPYKARGTQAIIDGLCAPSDSVRFCLGVLGNVNRNPVTVSARRQIGRGCRLNQEGDDVFLECLSESPIFVQCPLYAAYNKDHLATVYRLPTNLRIKVFDKPTFDVFVNRAKSEGFNAIYTLQTMCHLRISFVKGWGEHYRRQTITATPCWVEVQFPTPLQILDKILMQTGGPHDRDIHSYT
ncbi:MH2 domain-containing protein [Ditylenchus destructor]|nr:MH2 domain-containing protein [Ditylenchus destructor]